jgi:hypothetical protein
MEISSALRAPITPAWPDSPCIHHQRERHQGDDFNRADDSRTTEEENMEHPEMRNTIFGQVLAELLEARGLEVTPFKVGKLAEQSGLDGWKLINRMADAGNEPPGYLDGLAAALELTRAERLQLAFAYSFERRAEQVITLPA